jgi:hypothetical protein
MNATRSSRALSSSTQSRPCACLGRPSHARSAHQCSPSNKAMRCSVTGCPSRRRAGGQRTIGSARKKNNAKCGKRVPPPSSCSRGKANSGPSWVIWPTHVPHAMLKQWVLSRVQGRHCSSIIGAGLQLSWLPLHHAPHSMQRAKSSPPCGLTLRSSGQPPGYRCLPLNSNVRLARMLGFEMLVCSSTVGSTRSVSKVSGVSLHCALAHHAASYGRPGFVTVRRLQYFALVASRSCPSSQPVA